MYPILEAQRPDRRIVGSRVSYVAHSFPSNDGVSSLIGWCRARTADDAGIVRLAALGLGVAQVKLGALDICRLGAHSYAAARGTHPAQHSYC